MCTMLLCLSIYRIEVLCIWKRKQSPDATYGHLLRAFVKGEFSDSATEMVAILS